MNKLFISIAIMALTLSCEREVVDAPAFDVTTDKSTYKAGDSVIFRFSGDPHNIVIWSGLSGHRYEYRDRNFAEGNKLELNFKSFSQLGVVDQSNLKLLVSTNFNGVYDAANVSAAQWDDITDRAVLSAGDDQVPSGVINLDDFASSNKDFAIAFRYVTSVVKPSTTQNRWVIRSFDLSSTSPEGDVISLCTMATAGWKSLSFAEDATQWSISTAQLLTARSFTELDDDWVITKQFNPNKVTPDRGEAIKNITTNMQKYVLVYPKPGTYKVTFVASNASYKNTVYEMKEFTIIITP